MSNSDYPLDSRRLEILHALLPHIPVTMQKFISIYIGFEELLNAIRLIQKSFLNNASTTSAPTQKTEDIVKILRDFCTPQENEMINMILNMNQMMSMYDTYKDTFQNFSNMDIGNLDIANLLNNFQSQPSVNQKSYSSEIDELFTNFM